MQIDNNALMKILSMNDDELKKVISAAASEGGLQLSNISSAEISGFRSALGGVKNDPRLLSKIIDATAESLKKQ